MGEASRTPKAQPGFALERHGKVDDE